MEPAPPAPPGRALSRHRRRHRRRIVVAGCFGVALGAGGWLAFDLATAYRELRGVSVSLARASDSGALVDPQGRTRALADLATAATRAARAERTLRTSIPVKLIAVVPGIAHQRLGAIELAADVRISATAGAQALRVVDSMASEHRIDGGRLPLEAMATMETTARDAAHALRPTVRRSASLWGPLRSARDQYDAEIEGAASRLADAADALAVARSFAGDGGPRRHLVAGLNNAELRDQGMVLSYAVVRFDDGRFAVERSGPITDLTLRRPAATPVPEGSAALFGSLEPTRVWQSVNATADFAWSSTAMLDMYREATGEQLDGVIAMDVPALAQLLRVVGPTRVPAIPEPVTAGNASRLLLHDLYARMPPGADQGPRREAVADVARATVERLAGGQHDPVQLARSLSVAARGGHLRLHSRDASEQQVFERLALGGAPASGGALDTRTFHYAVHNATGTKLDYFTRHRVRFDIRTTSAGSAIVRTTVSVDNTAPTDASPSYAMGPTVNQARAGQYVGRVYVWGPRGGEQFDSLDESGLRATGRVVVAEPQASGSVEVETILKGAVVDGRLPLRLVPQPLVRPARVEVVIDGVTRVDRAWDRTLDLELAV